MSGPLFSGAEQPFIDKRALLLFPIGSKHQRQTYRVWDHSYVAGWPPRPMNELYVYVTPLQ